MSLFLDIEACGIKSYGLQFRVNAGRQIPTLFVRNNGRAPTKLSTHQ